MNTEFEKYSKLLADALQKTGILQSTDNYKDFDYFVKGDISGIQEFIFNVKSRGAAKTLKGKSLYVQAASELCLAFAENQFGETNIKLLYNGGGDFYFFLKNTTERQIERFKTTILEQMLHKEIHIDLTHIPIQNTDFQNFGKVWSAINKASAAQQLQKHKTTKFDLLFKPFEFEKTKENLSWKEFTLRYTKKEKAIIRAASPNENTDEPQLFDLEYHFTGSWNNKNSKLPTWTKLLIAKYSDVIQDKEEQANDNFDDDFQQPEEGNIIEFDYLARFAAERCGTSKLGILKVDVDNLGDFFGKRQDIHELKACSESLGWFFEKYLINNLLHQSFEFLELDKDENGKPIQDKSNEKKHYKLDVPVF